MSVGAPNLGSASVKIVPDLARFNGLVDRALAPLSGRFGKFTKAAAVGLGGLAVTAAGVGTALFEIGNDFQGAYNRIRVDTGATGRRLAVLEGTFKRVVSTVPADFGMAAGAVGKLNERLGVTGKPLERISVAMLRLSRITGEDLNENVAAVTRLFGDWSIKTDRQVGTLNKLYRIAQFSGIGVGELSRLMVQFGSPLRQLGLDFDFSAAMFARFEREGVNIQTVLPGLRFALRTFAKEGKDPAKGLVETFDAIRRLGRGARATQLAFRVFGARAGPDIAAAVQEGRFELSRYIAVMNRGRDTLQRASRDTSTLAGKFNLLKNRALVLLEPVAIRVFDAVNRGMASVMRIDFRRLVGETAGVRAAFASFGTAVFPVISGVAHLALELAQLGLSFSQSRVGMALLGAATGALLGRMIALGAAFAIGKVVEFIGSIRALVATFGVLRAVYIAQTGATNASTGAVLRFALAQKIAAASSRGMSAAMASTGIGALAVVAGTVIGALAGIDAGNRRTTTSAKQLTDAMRDQADALRAVRDIDLDAARAKTRVRQANLTVEVTERRLQRLRAQGKQGTAQYKQTEIDLENARQEQRQATRDLGDVEAQAEGKRREANARAREQISTGNKRIDTLRGEIKALNEDLAVETRRSRGIRGVGLSEKNRAKAQAEAAKTADQLAAKQRELNATLGRVSSIRRQADLVNRLRDRLGGLRVGTDAYRRTNDRLVRATQGLINRLNDVRPATGRAGRGFSTLRGNVGGLGGAMGDTATYTQNAVNRLLTSFGARPLGVGVRPFRMTAGQRFMQSLGLGPGLQRGGFPKSMVVPGTGTGDSVHLQAMVEPGERVFVLNRNASRHLDKLTALNERVPRFPGYQSGGLVGGAIAKADEIDRHHYPYSWGGGHDSNFTPPYDCSGAWSSVLHSVGLLGSPMVSGAMMGLGRPGAGAITVLANPEHVYGMLLGRAWGTSSTNPGGGAGWIEGGGVRPGFAIRHMGPTDGDMRIGELAITGGTRAMRGLVRGAADKMRAGANRYLAKTIRFAQPGIAGDGSDLGAGGRFGKAQLRALWVQAGGPASVANIAAAVALAESSGNPNAINHNTDGSIDRGLWQINSVHGALSTLDVLANARAAVSISNGGSDWLPWVTYRTGAYRQFLQRGGLLGLQAGASGSGWGWRPFSSASRRRSGRGGRDPLWRAVRRTLRTIAHGRRRRRSTVLHRLLRRIQGLAIGRDLANRIAGYEREQQVYGERAEYASQLTSSTTDGDGNEVEVPGVYGGKGEVDWLKLQQDALFNWRNAMLKARRRVRELAQRVADLLERARRRAHDVAQRIIEQGRVRSDLEKALEALNGDPRDERRKLEQRLRRLREHPRRNHDEIVSVQRQLDALDGDRRRRRAELRDRIETITRAQRERVRVRDNLTRRIIPDFVDRGRALGDENTTYGENLTTVQGSGDGYPWDNVLPTLPELTSSSALGGQIFSVQLRLRDLQAPKVVSTDRSGSGDDGSGTGTEDDSQRMQILEQLLREEQQRSYVANQQFAVLKQIPFAGVFHSGGVVPGPIGQEALALVQGGEVVSPIGGGTMPTVLVKGDIVSAHRDPVELLLGDKRFTLAVEQANRDSYRRAKAGARQGKLRRG